MDDLDRYLYLAFAVASLCALLRVGQRCLGRPSLTMERHDDASDIVDISAARGVTRCRNLAPREARDPQSAAANRPRPVRLTR